MSSLNKFELNKLIVSMRHNVKRAKVQTVNKLIRQVKQLKNKKALDELKKKNETKAERLVNEVLIMKKIPPDEVSAFTLSNTKKVDEILSDPDSSLRLKALARLSNHKSLTPIVTQFRTRYPSWEMEFPKVLIALKKREKIKAVNKEAKKEISENEEESSEDEMPESGSEDEAISDEEIVLHSTERKMSNTNSKSNNTLAMECEIVSTRGNRFSVSSDDFEPKNCVQSQENSIECEKPSSVTTPNGKSGKINKFNKEVTKINKPELEIKRKENIVGKRQLENNSHSNQIIKKTTDSFFLSTDNKPHKTIDHSANKKNIRNYNDDTDENDSYDSDSERSKPKQFSSNKNNRFNKNPKESKNFNVKNNSNIFNKSKKIGFENKQNVNRSKAQVTKSTNESTEKLHPSWAAKKKMVSIANFEGKKVTFD